MISFLSSRETNPKGFDLIALKTLIHIVYNLAISFQYFSFIIDYKNFSFYIFYLVLALSPS